MTEERFVEGWRIGSITTINKFKGVMNDLIRGYPTHLYFGIFESYFKENAKEVIKFLEDDGIIKTIPSKKVGELPMYRVTPIGIAFATSMAQLEYAEKMHVFTKIILLLTGATLFIVLEQLLITLFFQ